MGRTEIERAIRESYAARRDEDVEAVLGFFTKDATYRISVNERLGPYGRELRGHEELRPHFTQLFHTWDWRTFQIGQLLIDTGDDPVRAAVHSTGIIKHAPSGREIEFETLDLLSFRGAKIASFVEFFDTDMLAQFTAQQVTVPG